MDTRASRPPSPATATSFASSHDAVASSAASRPSRRGRRGPAAGSRVAPIPAAIPRRSGNHRFWRTRTVARWFGLASSTALPRPPALQPPPLPRPGQLLLITGPSGAGKSTLLRRLLRSIPAPQRITLEHMRLRQRPLVELFSLSLQRTLELLSRVGLAEAHLYLATPAQLSEGQRWRLRLALALARVAQNPARRRILVADEFAAPLDRITAAVVSHAVRRAVTGSSSLSAILVTSHDDLVRPLQPHLYVRCDFGGVTQSFSP